MSTEKFTSASDAAFTAATESINLAIQEIRREQEGDGEYGAAQALATVAVAEALLSIALIVDENKGGGR